MTSPCLDPGPPGPLKLTGSPTTQPPDSQIDLLKRLAALQAPDKDAVTQATKALRDADQRQKAADQTVAGKSDQLATLLDHALRFHKDHGDGDCPVCGNGTTTGGIHATSAA